jgi:hypothetical protein
MSYKEQIESTLHSQPRRFELSSDNNATAQRRAALAADEVRADSDVPDLVSIARINGETFAVRGDISFVSGKPKAGKSVVSAALAASALLPIGHTQDTLCIDVLPANGRPVVLVDTEQPLANTKKLAGNVCRLMGIPPAEQPGNLHIYNLRSYPKAEKLQKVKDAFDAHPDAHLWVIDGLADLIDDVNGATESGKIVDWFMMQASTLNTTIVLVVHENPGTDKMRGHLGSEAERKGGGVIAISKDKEAGCHIIRSKLLRNGPDFEPVYFSWSEGRKYFVTDGRGPALTSAEKDKDERELARECFPEGTVALRHVQLTQRIKEVRGVKDTSASNWLKRMRDRGTILKREVEEDYVLSPSLAIDLLPSPGFQTGISLPHHPAIHTTSPHEDL